MNTTQQNVLALLRAALESQNKIELIDPDWKAIFTEMKVQTVAALPADVILSMEEAPPVAKAAWQREALQNVAISTRLSHEEYALVKLLKDNDIPSIVMKGTAAAVYYPKPEYRAMGDIDLLVLPEDFEKTCSVLESHEYDLYRGALDGHHHAEYFKNECMIEVHYKFNSGRGKEEDEFLSDLLYQGVKEAKTIENAGYQIPVMPKLQNGLVILQHIANHLRGGLGLRQMIDWMMFVQAEMNEEFWTSSFGPAARKLHLEKIAIAATEMCRLYLGLSAEACRWYESEDEEIAHSLMEYILTKGNFGRKTHKTERGVGVFSNRSFWEFLKALQERGVSHWEALKRHSWLRPFAWFYQICRYIKLGLTRKNPLKSAKEDYAISRERKQFFKDLDVDLEKIRQD